jgi:hypothetical protein
MATLIKSRSLIFNATGDRYDPVVHCRSVVLQTNAGVAGDALTITDGAGDVIFHYRTKNTVDEVDFLQGNHYACRGMVVTSMPAGGQVLVLLR